MPLDYRDAFLFAAWLLILARIHRLGTAWRYRPFVAYVLCAMLSLAARKGAAWHWGIRSGEYVQVATATEVIFFIAAAVLLLWLHWMPSGPNWRHDWPILAFAAAVVLLEIWASPGSHILLRFSRAAVFFRALLGFKTLLRCFGAPGFRIGRNLGGALICEFFPSAVHSVAETLYLSSVLPYASLSDLASFLHIAGWGIAAWSNLDLDPPEKDR